MKKRTRDQEEALEQLHSLLKPGSTVHTIVRHVSSSGMTRHIGVVILTPEGAIHPNYSVGQLLGYRGNKNGDGLVVSGCGMDMGFHLVYSLSRGLWPRGFGCIGEKCRSNDHSNGDRDRTPHCDKTCEIPPVRVHPEGETCKRHWHLDGGYALRQEWL